MILWRFAILSETKFTFQFFLIVSRIFGLFEKGIHLTFHHSCYAKMPRLDCVLPKKLDFSQM